MYQAVLQGPGGFRKAVALKVLHTGASELRREARIGGLLRHENLVDVYEIGEHDGQWFAALELCDGTLADHAPLPARALVEVGLQICRALQYAHQELGLVHLDLKPQNLLLCDGRVKVADLGIARAEGFEGDGRIRGTPAYMAPEQAAGWPVDARTDVYALGITLNDLAIGLPYVASTTMDLGDFDQGDPSTLDFSLDDLPEAIAQADAAAELPAWLEEIVQRCIAPSPSERFQSMGELAEALAAVQADGPGLHEHIHWVEEVTTVADLRGTNLKPGRDTFLGRRDELASLAERLGEPGLTTLKGPAGIGKSRLARRAAWSWYGRDRQAWFVDLHEVQDTAGLIGAIAHTLGMRLTRGTATELVGQMGQSLAGRGEVLLVLDNFEAIVGLGPMLPELMRSAPQLRILVTSRRKLDLDIERVVEVEPLDRETALDLLADRARARGADVAADPDLGALAEKLDGVPLALELAAGRLGVLSVREVLDRLGLSLLRRGSSGRHGTLSAALEWSWERLTPDEQRVLSQLSVFAGGFTLEAAEQVVEHPGSILDVVGALVDHSMVRSLDEERFDLLVVVRAFAAEHLDEPGPVEQRHGAFFGRLGTIDALDALLHHGGTTRRLALGIEHANLVAACQRAVDREDEVVAAATLAAAYEAIDLTGPYAEVRQLADRVLALDPKAPLPAALALIAAARAELAAGFLHPAIELARRALARASETGDTRLECNARSTLGYSQQLKGVYAEALGTHRQNLDAARAAGLRAQEAVSLTGIGLALDAVGQVDEALVAYQTAIALYREVGHRSSEGATLGNLGGVYQKRQQFSEARDCYEAALTIARELGSRRSEGIWLGNLGILLRVLGQPDEAMEHYQAALAIHREVGNRSFVATVLSNMGRIAAESGDHEGGHQMFLEALEIARAMGQAHSEAVALANLGALARLRGRPDEARAHWAEALALAEPIGDASLLGPLRKMLAELDD